MVYRLRTRPLVEAKIISSAFRSCEKAGGGLMGNAIANCATIRLGYEDFHMTCSIDAFESLVDGDACSLVLGQLLVVS